MASPQLRLVGGAAAIFLCAFVYAGTGGSQTREPEGNYGIGNRGVFLRKYLAYRAQQLNDNQPQVLRIRLGYVKGLSRSFTAMVGEMAVDLESGAYRVSLNGLTPGATYSVWLVDGSETAGVADAVVRLATILAARPSVLRTGVLGLNLPLGFTIDRVVVVPGTAWVPEVLAAGSVNVFQKIFFRRLSLLNESTSAVEFKETTLAPPLLALVPDLAAETEAARTASTNTTSSSLTQDFAMPLLETTLSGGSSSSSVPVPLDVLISQGAKLFFEETFAGNGRTCGTCHPASNNFTIDPNFIATLPSNDPLFVAEFNPALKQLERPQLMRLFGLILENLDGLDNPTTKFVMRGVPHTLGLNVSLQTSSTLNPPAPAEMTGWSGDGAPGAGSLHDFATGAVIQHFTKTLQRRVGRDFRLPSVHELDAMEVFQLSLGRNSDFDLDSIDFKDDNLDAGKSLFTGQNPEGGNCAFCHSNAGALVNLPSKQNRNFNTNVEDVDHPARLIEDFPKDGGFGQAANSAGTFGNFTFNTPPAVEAADTPPFLHNNLVSTLEDVARFYAGPEFRKGHLNASFVFDDTQINQIADFLRGMNTLQNINVAQRELQEILAINGNPQKEQRTRLQTASEDAQDAIFVLNEGGIFPAAVMHLDSALELIGQAQQTNDPSQRRKFVQQAIAELDGARDDVATFAQ